MQSTETNIEPLIDEYTTLVAETIPVYRESESVAWGDLEIALCHSGDWTALGAQSIVALARQHGSFMLRNALALSIALNIEDGELGF